MISISPNPSLQSGRRQHVFDLVARNPDTARRNNYSLASNQATENTLRFNVRIATPPPGQDCPPGIGSAWVFNLKPGDKVTAIGPFGDFHIKPTRKEAVYIGGGAGHGSAARPSVPPFRNRKNRPPGQLLVRRPLQAGNLLRGHVRQMAEQHANFSFHLALSDPLPEDNWTGETGFIHEVVRRSYLADHPNPSAVEFYLCGPPMMIKACNRDVVRSGRFRMSRSPTMSSDRSLARCRFSCLHHGRVDHGRGTSSLSDPDSFRPPFWQSSQPGDVAACGGTALRRRGHRDPERRHLRSAAPAERRQRIGFHMSLRGHGGEDGMQADQGGRQP